MKTVFAKLNLREEREILVLNAPESFAAETDALRDVKVLTRAKDVRKLVFALIFVTRQSEVDHLAGEIAAKTVGDVVWWFAYPKGTSKKYSCDFNRDTGWESMRALGFDTVRQIAIDEDWSALRFRRVAFIKPR